MPANKRKKKRGEEGTQKQQIANGKKLFFFFFPPPSHAVVILNDEAARIAALAAPLIPVSWIPDSTSVRQRRQRSIFDDIAWRRLHSAAVKFWKRSAVDVSSHSYKR